MKKEYNSPAVVGLTASVTFAAPAILAALPAVVAVSTAVSSVAKAIGDNFSSMNVESLLPCLEA